MRLEHQQATTMPENSGHVSTPAADDTVLIIENLDQASVRALLTLLWDASHEVLSFEAKNRK